MPAHAYDSAPAPADSEVRARAKTLTATDDESPEAILASVCIAAGISKRQLGPLSRNRDGDPLSMTLGFKWLDRAHPGCLPRIDVVLSWPARLRNAFAARLASDHRPAVDLVRGVLTTGREFGDVQAAMLDALSPGSDGGDALTLNECRTLRREVAEMRRAADSLDAWLAREEARLVSEK